MKARLGVNIDHIATLRQVRGEHYPNLMEALPILKECGASQVTLHLREDRRHVQLFDLTQALQKNILPVNLEMATTPSMMALAIKLKPKMVTLVPEMRGEITTEGGFNALLSPSKARAFKTSLLKLKQNKIEVSLFLDPDINQIQAAFDLGADAVEIHTGSYCSKVERLHYGPQKLSYDLALRQPSVLTQIKKIERASQKINELGLRVYAGHGLHMFNLKPLVDLKLIEEYNIGHAIIARAVFVGLKAAILEIKQILNEHDTRL